MKEQMIISSESLNNNEAAHALWATLVHNEMLEQVGCKQLPFACEVQVVVNGHGVSFEHFLERYAKEINRIAEKKARAMIDERVGDIYADLATLSKAIKSKSKLYEDEY